MEGKHCLHQYRAYCAENANCVQFVYQTALQFCSIAGILGATICTAGVPKFAPRTTAVPVTPPSTPLAPAKSVGSLLSDISDRNSPSKKTASLVDDDDKLDVLAQQLFHDNSDDDSNGDADLVDADSRSSKDPMFVYSPCPALALGCAPRLEIREEHKHMHRVLFPESDELSVDNIITSSAVAKTTEQKQTSQLPAVSVKFISYILIATAFHGLAAAVLADWTGLSLWMMTLIHNDVTALCALIMSRQISSVVISSE